ncbi:MAG TPA: hypoxanthine phosphoribosyltransferase [Bacteroidales bacterium]|jgi:hypoxanthine phosphoribosyltransferase|nr:hypoxanthine phosphoribosyltransferase [Bacteroidales bacterium]HQG77060.1 hypoxanthine phosphoribosyltransferase [Bacteroidales bacterium]
MMGLKEVYILGKKFRELIPEQSLQERIDELAARINNDFAGREVVFVGILNGAFMFAADLFRRLDLQARITFIKLASYAGTSSTGTVRELIGWNEDLKDKQVIIIDDIVDRGDTLEYAVNNLIIRNVTDIKVAVLLLKPGSYRKNIRIDYVGYEIPNDFVAGYGLDYNGFGRNLTSIYSLVG